MTISTSSAPLITAFLASKAFVSGVFAPSGKPITVQVLTVEFRRRLLTSFVQNGLTHTEAKPKVSASSHTRFMSLSVASGLSRVWSMIDAISL